jgi:hypothetical protein
VSEDEFRVVVGWLVSTFRPLGSYPLLVAAGEQGSGKSVFSRMMILLTDPCAAPLRSLAQGRTRPHRRRNEWSGSTTCQSWNDTDREMITFEGQHPYC